jgi:hypothetical protein
MRSELFQPTIAGEARLLLLIDGFSAKGNSLEGRTKLAKLDFLLRYPGYLERAIAIRRPTPDIVRVPLENTDTIENRMVRYRYGPWDPAYYALLGRLIGQGLVEQVPLKGGMGYRTTDRGKALAVQLGETSAWQPITLTVKLLKRHFNVSGTNLKNFIYQNFPEVTQATWGDEL